MRRRAEVVIINELSGHAGQSELLSWLQPIARRLRGIFLVHGELVQQEALKRAVEERFTVPVHIPRRGEQVQI